MEFHIEKQKLCQGICGDLFELIIVVSGQLQLKNQLLTGGKYTEMKPLLCWDN